MLFVVAILVFKLLGNTVCLPTKKFSFSAADEKRSPLDWESVWVVSLLFDFKFALFSTLLSTNSSEGGSLEENAKKF